ncbi:MAG: hypothetical protein HC888_03170 [Candidatus Competibacteraceae bacterium]|nr:hypothetical protein [Candidatus Competibacteraceae bacterium]
MQKRPRFKTAAIPDIEPVNYVVAVNSLSLAPDPMATVAQLGDMMQPDGLLIWLDLLCWRVETPPPRRLASIDRMAACLEEAGLLVIRRASKIPLVEDWGYERSYHWLNHMVVGRKRSR